VAQQRVELSVQEQRLVFVDAVHEAMKMSG